MIIKILFQFVISGLIVVLATYLSSKIGQKWAGLIVAAPLLTLLTFVFLSIDHSNGSLREYLASSLIFMIPAAAFILCLMLLSDRLNFIANIAASFCIYSVVVLCIYKLQ
jgi:uncharacterized membrane protein (GlpM family)